MKTITAYYFLLLGTATLAYAMDQLAPIYPSTPLLTNPHEQKLRTAIKTHDITTFDRLLGTIPTENLYLLLDQSTLIHDAKKQCDDEKNDLSNSTNEPRIKQLCIGTACLLFSVYGFAVGIGARMVGTDTSISEALMVTAGVCGYQSMRSLFNFSRNSQIHINHTLSAQMITMLIEKHRSLSLVNISTT